MPLLSIMISNPDAIRTLRIDQIVATAGDGRLRDGTESQNELREYLKQVSVESLAGYADQCLSESFTKSGQVLQDIVNELGRRLEYDVTNGRYQGTSNAIGFDGLWRDSSGHNIIVEVKTTDVYRLSLETLIKYRDQLLSQNKISGTCSILIVVGRNETGELEAQVRGSRHAWDIRLISVDSILNLVRIKESADSQETIAKMRRLLTPLEYTRLDELVDVVFTTTKDVQTSLSIDTGVIGETDKDEKSAESSWQFTPSHVINEVREHIISSFGVKMGVSFVKKSGALYWSPDRTQRVVCTISKRYSNQSSMKYWYAYHPQWLDFLTQGEKSHFILGCTDMNYAFALPNSVILEHLKEFHTTERKDGSGVYYHIRITENRDGKYALQLPLSGEHIMLEPYTIKPK